MFNELINVTLITVGIVFLLTLIGILVAVIHKWKLIKYFLLVLIPLLGFPIIFRLTNSFIYSKYNYHILANSYDELLNNLSDKYQRPEIIPIGKKYDVYHSSYEWYYRCIIDDKNFEKLITLGDKNNLIKLDINNTINKDDLNYFKKINSSDFLWNRKIESKINANGSKIFILRNSISHDTCVYRNRF